MRSTGPADGERTRTFTEEARRKQIIECAITTLAEVGYAHASLAQIAKRANISKGVISYHFAGKDELLEQTIVHVYTKGAEYVVPRILAADTVRGAVRAYIESNIEWLGEHRDEAIAVGEIVLNLRTDEGGLQYGPHTDEPMLKPLEDMFTDGQQKGEFGDFDVRVMAIAVRRAIDSVPGVLAYRDDIDAATFGREYANLFDRATRKDP